MSPPPHWRVPRLPERVENPSDARWDSIPRLTPFELADGSGAAQRQTELRMGHDGTRLHLRFVCEASELRASYVERDAPLHEEDVVEVFIAPEAATPTQYYEFEVNPLGALFDARVRNPFSDRERMSVDPRWDCPGVAWSVRADPARRRWSAWLSFPWSALVGEGARPASWRANFCRIDRPSDDEPEFSCWVPTRTVPADFHKPECFGRLDIEDLPRVSKDVGGARRPPVQ